MMVFTLLKIYIQAYLIKYACTFTVFAEFWRFLHVKLNEHAYLIKYHGIFNFLRNDRVSFQLK